MLPCIPSALFTSLVCFWSVPAPPDQSLPLSSSSYSSSPTHTVFRQSMTVITSKTITYATTPGSLANAVSVVRCCFMRADSDAPHSFV